MSLDPNVELLQELPIFAGLPEDKLSSIVRQVRKTFFRRGQTIITRNEPGEAAYLILSGTAKIESGPGIAADSDDALVEAGVLLGETAMLVESTYGATVVAAERVRALAIEREVLYQIMKRDPDIAEHFSDKLLDRLLGIADQLREMETTFEALEQSLDSALSDDSCDAVMINAGTRAASSYASQVLRPAG